MNVSSMLAELRAERDRLDQAISALEGIAGRSGATARRVGAQAAARGVGRRRNLSAAARKRISDAQKKRWAAVRKAKAAA